jgi:hypothetical protein
MSQAFTPNINKKAFADTISQIQKQEGNNIVTLRAIQSKMDEYVGLHLYDVFIQICKQYNIDFCSDETNSHTFTITINVNNRPHSLLTYHEQGKDIAATLAKSLYSILATQISNELFVHNVKRHASF